MIVEEMSTWTIDEVLVHIHESLPEGWRFQYQTEDRFTSASIRDTEGVEQWASEEPLPDVRMIFLEAYGWLNTRTRTIRHPAWSRRTDFSHKAVEERFGIKVAVPDPEDLDPLVIEAELQKKFR